MIDIDPQVVGLITMFFVGAAVTAFFFSWLTSRARKRDAAKLEQKQL